MAELNEQEEQKKEKKKAAADGIFTFYFFIVIIHVLQIKDKGLKVMFEVGAIGFIGVILMFIGTDLVLRPERKNKIIGDVLVTSAIVLLLIKGLIWGLT